MSNEKKLNIFNNDSTASYEILPKVYDDDGQALVYLRSSYNGRDIIVNLTEENLSELYSALTGMTPSDLQKRIKELEDELSQYKPKLPFEDHNNCIHPMNKREGYIKCGVCNKEFK